MNDIRLQEKTFHFDGKDYILRCNMSVLAEIQKECGQIPNLLNDSSAIENFLIFLSAMMNDYADEMGWAERFTPKGLGRKLDLKQSGIVSEVMTIVIDALYTKTDSEEKTEEPKN